MTEARKSRLVATRGLPVDSCVCGRRAGRAVDCSEELYPGDAYVDVFGVDYYDNGRHVDQASWDEVASSTTAGGAPHGLYTRQAFAESHGKPFALPEWRLDTDTSVDNDNPFFIEKMNEFFHQNAGTGPGEVLYEQYFSAWDSNRLPPPTQLPNASAMYLSLAWSDGVGVSWP